MKSELDRRGVNLFGVVHEERGVKEFKPFLKGEVYLDTKVCWSSGWYNISCVSFFVLRQGVAIVYNGSTQLTQPLV